MSRARDAARLERELQIAQRRQSAAHRAMRTRAARGGAHAAGVDKRERPVRPAVVEPTPAPVENSPAPAAPPSDAAATVARVSVISERTPTAELDQPEWLEDDGASTEVLPPVVVTVADAGAEQSVAPAEESVPPPAPAVTFAEALDQPAAAEPVADKPKKRRRGWVAIPIVIVALGIGYVGAQALLAGTVARDTTSFGVAIGGMSTGQAVGAIQQEADALAAQPITLTVADASYDVIPTEAGLGVDAQATVAQVTGFTLDPQRLWSHVVGGGDIPAVLTVDDEALDEATNDAVAALDRTAMDAEVEIVGTSAEMVPGQVGIEVDAEAARQQIEQAWPGRTDVEVRALVEDPTTSDATAQAFADEVNTTVFSGPVTMTGENGNAPVTVAQMATNATVVHTDAEFELVIDGEPIATALVEDKPKLNTEPKDASYEFDGDDLKVDPGSPGMAIDGATMGDAVLAATVKDNRRGEFPYVQVQGENSAEKLGVGDFQEIVASFDTPLTAEPIRTENLINAASKVRGTVLMPGDEFDLHEVLSPIDAAHGYHDAHVIVDGVLTTGIGGGLSQMATTSYNAAYFAGYELLQHRPHSVWFERYPAGRESTLWGTTINVRFTNTTPYAAVFNSYVSGGRLHVDVWSTPYFTVDTSVSEKTNFRQPGVKEVEAENCEAKGPGQPGFTITNTRSVLLDGEEVDRNVDTWTYLPDDAIKCV